MASSSSSSTNPSNLIPVNFKIPSKNYSHTVTTQTLEISTNIEDKVATIELHVQATLPISAGLASYIEPFIVHNAVEMGQRCGDKEFKIVFDIKVVDIDLADYNECDGYRRRGLV
ncbi:hypothetical protein TSUD_122170 [Trifolium subterraneum]|nr:hypothetical protein TSUD_122170 [Trifolium subterraneum]